MAFEISDGGATPHATNYSDLLDKLITFLTGTGVWYLHDDKRGSVGEVTLRGEGLAGTENIYVGVKRYSDAINDIYGWILQGYTGFTDAGFLINPGAITGNYAPAVPLWNSTIPYWFFANARRFIMVAKVDTVYISMYAGHILPYGSPGHWFYPLCIAGSHVTPHGMASHVRYSDTSGSMSSPFLSNATSGVFDTTRSHICIRLADGTWARIYNGGGSFIPAGGGFSDTVWTARGIHPPVQALYPNLFQNDGSRGYRQLRPNQAGDRAVIPLRMMYDTNNADALGIYDDAYYVPGFGVTAEDTISIGADEYIIFNDVFRVNLDSYFAIKKV